MMNLDQQRLMVDLLEADPRGQIVVATDQDGLLVQDHLDQVVMARDPEATAILEVMKL
jgi:hypothetical protein